MTIGDFAAAFVMLACVYGLLWLIDKAVGVIERRRIARLVNGEFRRIRGMHS